MLSVQRQPDTLSYGPRLPRTDGVRMNILKPKKHDVVLEEITEATAWRAVDNGLAALERYPYQLSLRIYPDDEVIFPPEQPLRTSVPRGTWNETVTRVEGLVRDANRSCILLSEIACRNPHTPLVIRASREMIRWTCLYVIWLTYKQHECWAAVCGEDLGCFIFSLFFCLWGSLVFLGCEIALFLVFLWFFVSPLTLLCDHRYRKFCFDGRNDEYLWLVDQIRTHPELRTDALDANIYSGLLFIAADLAEREISVPVTHDVRDIAYDEDGADLVRCDVWSLWFPHSGLPEAIPV